jgi:predicted porin
MRSFLKTTVGRHTARALLVGCILVLAAGPAAAVDEAMLKRMEELIQKQQQQIEAQNRAIEKLQQQVGELSDTAVQEATEAAKAEVAKAVPPDVVRSTNGDKVKLQIYGHVNRAYLFADDGDSSDSYFVDNDNSSSRMGFLGEAKVNDDVTLGGKFEFEYQSNPSNVVSQDNKNPGDSGDGTGFDERWVDAQITSKRFGKLYLGKGSTASDGTSEVDLSGTDVVAYSSISDMAGGIRFYDDDTNTLTNTDVGDVFDNLDGLSRRNRLRYDSPTFWGFSLQGSVLSDGGDVALKYAAKFGENWKFAAAASYANPQAQRNDIDDQVNGSASILHSSGLNLTLAGAVADLRHDEENPDGSSRSDDPKYMYAKLGYRSNFFKFGETRFSVDFARSDDRDQDRDEATSIGAALVQDLSQWGMEYYLGYRWYDLDRGEGSADFDSINAVMSGVRVKF